MFHFLNLLLILLIYKLNNSFNPWVHAPAFVALAYAWDKSHIILSAIIFIVKYVLKTNAMLYTVKCIKISSFLGKKSCTDILYRIML